jgi:transposase
MSDAMSNTIKETLEQINKKLDIILVIMLAKSGVNQSEIAKIVGISERTIRRWLPFKQIKQSRKEE